MSPHLRLRLALLRASWPPVLALTVVLGGCGDNARPASDGGGQDTGTDAGQDGVSDGGNDGSSDGGADGGIACYQVTFMSPTDGAMLTAADDKSGNQCAGGFFHYDVKIATSAPDSTQVVLMANTSNVSSATVLNGHATFSNVQLDAQGSIQLSVQFPSTLPCTAASTGASITIDCNVPTCTISEPDHPVLNGVPAAQGGDRVSAGGQPYQAAFAVTTNVENGQTVRLQVANMSSPNNVTTMTSTATGGTAMFAGVALVPDGTYLVQAACTARNGVVGRSSQGMFVVDTTPPQLTVSRPSDGQFFSMGQVQVCGSTTSADAYALPPSVGTLANNFCVSAGGGTSCAAETAAAIDACVTLSCNGGAPFDVTVNLNDGAGNVAAQVVHGISCVSSLPSVQIVTPVSDAPGFVDPTKHLLAAGTQPFSDADPGTSGAQTSVMACTNRNGPAQLYVGLKGGTLAAVGGPVATTAAGPGQCPTGLGFVAQFSGVTLAESSENLDGSLSMPTELRVDVTDPQTAAAVGSSPLVDIWVDSQAPTISLSSPANLCGSFQQATTFTTDIVLNTDSRSVVLAVTHDSSTDTFSNPSIGGGSATFTAVPFPEGANDLAATASDPAGNSTVMAPAPCTVTVGAAPVVTFTRPTAANLLCAATSPNPSCLPDGNAGLAGWQGTVAVNVTGDGAPLAGVSVTFMIGTTVLGVRATDPSGDAQLSGVTVPDGEPVTITATTASVPNRGVGTGSVSVNVLTLPPGPPTGLKDPPDVAVRRETSFQLSWTAPADENGKAVASYEVRVAKVPITAGNFDNPAVTTAVPFASTPAPPSRPDGTIVHKLRVETSYFFAVAATDLAGNRSTIVPTTAAVNVPLLVTTLSGQATTDHLGYAVEGTADFGSAAGSALARDGLSDLVAGGMVAQKVYLYFGTSNGYPATPSVTITGSVAGFGLAVANAGDVDGDGLDDLAISSPFDGNGKVFIFSRKNPSWANNGTWPSTLNDTQANYVITADASYAGNFFAQTLTTGRRFESTTADDLLIGTPGLANNAGQVLVLKGGTSFGSVTLPDATRTVVINGTNANDLLGFGIVDVGSFDGNPGSWLLASSTGISRVDAFTAAGLPAAVNGVSASVDSTVFSPASDAYGGPVSVLGPLGNSPAAIAIGAIGFFVDVHLGTAATGPFLGAAGGAPAPSVRFVDPASSNSFGVVTLGTGVPGSGRALSFIDGDTLPDLILAGQVEPGNPLYIISGADLTSMSGTVNVTTAANVLRVPNRVPANWTGYAGMSIIVDSNGDGFPDIALGEFKSNNAGRVLILY
jgi:hypothetical protein